VRKDCDTSHDWLYGVSIHHTFLAAGNEEGGFATFEVIIEIDQEGEERGLTSVWWGRVVLVCVGHRIDAGWWPCAVCALKKSALVTAELWMLTNMTSVLCTRHVSIHTKSSVDPSYLSTCDRLWYKCFDSVPKLIVEGLVYHPVKVVGENARVLIATDGRVWDELHCLACSNDGRTLFGGQDVLDHSEIRHHRMIVHCRLRSVGEQDCVILGGKKHSRVEIGRLPFDTRRSLDDSELFFQIGRT